MRCKVCISYELRIFLQEKRCHANSICRTLFQTKRVCFTQTLYQHQSALPYMGCCTLWSCSSNKGPRILGPTIQLTKALIGIVHKVVVVDVVVVVVVVVDDDLELLQRWSPAGQLKLKLLNIFAVSTNIVPWDKTNNCRTWDQGYHEILLLRAAVFGIAFPIS